MEMSNVTAQRAWFQRHIVRDVSDKSDAMWFKFKLLLSFPFSFAFSVLISFQFLKLESVSERVRERDREFYSLVYHPSHPSCLFWGRIKGRCWLRKEMATVETQTGDWPS